MSFQIAQGGMSSDEALLAVELEIRDPRDLPGLVNRIPVGVLAIYIERVYHYPDEKILCAICHAARHHKGYVVRLSDGTAALIGNCCGSKIFPGTFTQHEQHFKRRVKRRDYLIRIKPVEKAIDAAIANLHHWTRPLAEFREWRREFQRRLPDVYLGLLKSKDGELSVARKVRDLAAEERRDLRRSSSQQGMGPKLYSNVRKTIGRFKGAKMFDAKEPLYLFYEVRDIFNETKKKLSRERLNDGDMAAILRSVDDAASFLREAHSIYSASTDFFTDENLQTIAKWLLASEDFSGRVKRVIRGTLVLSYDWQDDIRLTRPNLPELDTTAIEILRAARRKAA